jgi:hypothetical protein
MGTGVAVRVGVGTVTIGVGVEVGSGVTAVPVAPRVTVARTLVDVLTGTELVALAVPRVAVAAFVFAATGAPVGAGNVPPPNGVPQAVSKATRTSNPANARITAPFLARRQCTNARMIA